jgi:IclR family transcriptional regulator, pca regulon regulatory protein
VTQVPVKPGDTRGQESSKAGDEPRERHLVQSLKRGLSVIRVLGDPGPGQTLADVARATGLTRAAARRFLLTLVDVGYARTDGRLFSLTPRTLELGYAYLSSLGLPEIAQPHLQRLVEQVHESSSVSVLDGDSVVYVARAASSQRIMSVAINVGTRLPAHITSMGRVLLAQLEPAELNAVLATISFAPVTANTIIAPDALRAELAQVREQGWAIVDQELEQGLRSIGAPIRGPDGKVVAAVNISTHATRSSMAHVREKLLPPLLKTAEAIGRDLPAS